MKTRFSTISSALAVVAVLLTAACSSDDELTIEELQAFEGTPIQFAGSVAADTRATQGDDAQTRVSYTTVTNGRLNNGSNQSPMQWQEGDSVLMVCPQAYTKHNKRQYGTYTVKLGTSDYTSYSATNYLAPASTADTICWARFTDDDKYMEAATTYNFYSVYPYGASDKHGMIASIDESTSTAPTTLTINYPASQAYQTATGSTTNAISHQLLYGSGSFALVNSGSPDQEITISYKALPTVLDMVIDFSELSDISSIIEASGSYTLNLAAEILDDVSDTAPNGTQRVIAGDGYSLPLSSGSLSVPSTAAGGATSVAWSKAQTMKSTTAEGLLFLLTNEDIPTTSRIKLTMTLVIPALNEEGNVIENLTNEKKYAIMLQPKTTITKSMIVPINLKYESAAVNPTFYAELNGFPVVVTTSSGFSSLDSF